MLMSDPAMFPGCFYLIGVSESVTNDFGQKLTCPDVVSASGSPNALHFLLHVYHALGRFRWPLGSCYWQNGRRRVCES